MQTQNQGFLLINLENASEETRKLADYLIGSKLFQAYCTPGYKDREQYTRDSDLIIKDKNFLYFFSFANTFAKYLSEKHN